jgi:hypothetical protein
VAYVGAALIAVLLLAAPAIAAEAQPFGIAQFTMQTTHTGASPPFVNEQYDFTQAGGHPFALTSKVTFASELVGGTRVPTNEAKDVAIDLPPGLLANPQAVSSCQSSQAEQCPVDSQVGVFVVRASSVTMLAPVFNVAPSGEEAAVLGVQTPLGLLVLSGQAVRTPRGYALSVLASGLIALGIVSVELTLWGTPADKAHDPQRGLTCLGNEANPESSCNGGGLPSGEEARPFLTMPSDCSAQAPTATVWADSWQEPGRYVKAESSLAAITSCDRLPFLTALAVRPDRLQAEAPVAVTLSLGVHQTEGAVTVAAPPLRGATVTLPQGMAINPAIGNGAQACAATGPQGIDLPSGVDALGEAISPAELGEGEEHGPGGEPRLAPGHCPEASIIGVAHARTPLLASALAGRVYLAAPGCGGTGPAQCGEQDAADGNLYRIYVELGGRGEQRPHGLIVKIAGEVLANPATGQLTVKLLESPQLPFSELSIELFGGGRALLANPPDCGPAQTSAVLEPWGAPYAPDASASSYYEVGGCPTPVPFAPGLIAGSYDVEAGAFTRFVASVTRNDLEQALSRVQIHAPAGLSAMLSSIAPCGEPQASAGDCSTASRIGGSTVALGSGRQPLYLKGDIYLTGPYEGAPFGLSIVTRALAGPLDLGQIVIRARVDLDPRSAALTITSDPLPQIRLGVPLRLRSLALDVDRPGFLLNPTDCRAQRVLAAIAGAQGALVAVSNPFGIGGCRGLVFAPSVSASTSAHTSIRDGASLDVKLSQPRAAPGTHANVAKLRISLPRALPTRLTALQGSCPASTFAADAAACPPTSVVGVASARTPLLAGRLSGPVYLLAHGRSAFPAPTVVLQGDGIRLDLSGSTAIDRRGVTSISFDALPDIPLQSVELYLPRGPHSALTATADLCALAGRSSSKRRPRLALPMPAQLIAHDGASVAETARIAVRGCPRH